MRNIALLIEYDGTAYCGWQIQNNGRSIQAALQEVLSRVLGEETKIIGAGRTDTGVHAHGQVANFHTSSDWKCDRFMFSLNGALPRDIAIRKVAEVPDRFHARYDAVMRRYLYRIVTTKSPIRSKYTAFMPYHLSLTMMRDASAHLIGEKDFRSFAKYASLVEEGSTNRRFVCAVHRAEWEVVEDELRFVIEANRFLHGMVRAIVGTLVDVGRGRISLDEFETVLLSHDRRNASMSVPATGLMLEQVVYPQNLWD